MGTQREWQVNFAEQERQLAVQRGGHQLAVLEDEAIDPLDRVLWGATQSSAERESYQALCDKIAKNVGGMIVAYTQSSDFGFRARGGIIAGPVEANFDVVPYFPRKRSDIHGVEARIAVPLADRAVVYRSEHGSLVPKIKETEDDSYESDYAKGKSTNLEIVSLYNSFDGRATPNSYVHSDDPDYVPVENVLVTPRDFNHALIRAPFVGLIKGYLMGRQSVADHVEVH